MSSFAPDVCVYNYSIIKTLSIVCSISLGDLMGPVVKNLHNLLRMPTGCGEQTMSSFSPDIFVYNYLQTTNQLTQEIKEKATMYMQKGVYDLFFSKLAC